MTSLPDWLVERVALDEVAPVMRGRVDRADPRELAERVAALCAHNAAELGAHPAGPAVAQIGQRIAREVSHRRRPRTRWLGIASALAAGFAILVVVGVRRTDEQYRRPAPDGEITRAKGSARLLVFRQVGEQAERLDEDALVRAGDLVQLRYHAGAQGYGVIASIDGAGVVTLHYPVSEDARPEATVLAPKTTTLPHAYALDDAPHFERFFFVTAAEPIDVQRTLAALGALGRRGDGATGSLELPAGLRQWSLRLRKPSPVTHEDRQ